MLGIGEWWVAELVIFRSWLRGYRRSGRRRRRPSRMAVASMSHRSSETVVRLAVVLRNAQWAINQPSRAERD